MWMFWKGPSNVKIRLFGLNSPGQGLKNNSTSDRTKRNAFLSNYSFSFEWNRSAQTCVARLLSVLRVFDLIEYLSMRHNLQFEIEWLETELFLLNRTEQDALRGREKCALEERKQNKKQGTQNCSKEYFSLSMPSISLEMLLRWACLKQIYTPTCCDSEVWNNGGGCNLVRI